jgi:hypothetical protein
LTFWSDTVERSAKRGSNRRDGGAAKDGLLQADIDLRPADEVSFYHRGPAPTDLYQPLGTCGCVIARQSGEGIDFSWSDQDRWEQKRMTTLVHSLPLVQVSQSGGGWTMESPPRDRTLA